VAEALKDNRGRESFITVSPYGSPFSNQSATNPYATDAPRLYDQQGNYRGKLSANPYDPDSTSNPYGRGLRIKRP